MDAVPARKRHREPAATSHVLALQRGGGNHALARRLQRFTDPQTKKVVRLDDIPGLDERSVRRYVRLLDEKLLTAPAEEQEALRARLATFTPMGGQAFGTNVPSTTKPHERVEIFKRALAAGYRLFDAAESYGSLDSLAEAATQSGIPLESLTIVYKPASTTMTQLVTSAQTGPPSGFQAKLEQPVPGIRPVLMLHDLATTMTETKVWLRHLAVSGGTCPSLGVSNVDIHALTELYEFAVELKCPLEFVQNPFSPYHQDHDVRRFCAAKHITYLGYGLFGGEGTGFCSSDVAVPARHLRILHDPRFLSLAGTCKFDPAKLLLAWASHKGVTVVIYTSSRAAENLATLDMRLEPKLIAEIDALFEFGGAKPGTAGKDAKLQPIYNAAEDPTAWFVLDLLAGNPAAKALLVNLIELAWARHSAALDACLSRMVQRILRFVTHLQKAAEVSDLHKGSPWQTRLPELFAWAAELGAAQRVFEWTQTDYLAVGDAYGAESVFASAVVHDPQAASTVKPVKAPSSSGTRRSETWERFKGRFISITASEDAEKDKEDVSVAAAGDTVEVYGDKTKEIWRLVSVDKTTGVEYDFLGTA